MSENRPSPTLFWGSFIALIATAFGFIVRAQIIGEWGGQFGLTATQQGEIFGVGLWPFAISIVLFSLVIDRIGYKSAMVFGFVCHVLSIIITVMAKNYWWLYVGTFIVALGNGTVEAYVNPVVATIYSKDKTKWLNILHAGWAGGLVLGGILAISMGQVAWQYKVMLLSLPTIVYFVMLIGQKFPVNERVTAGIPYRDMLKEVGAVGMFIIAWMILAELIRVTKLPLGGLTPVEMGAIAAAVIAVAFFALVRSLGRPMYIFLLLVMILLATTELGVDGWVTELMKPAMGDNWAPWLLVYTSAIMMVLRLCAGPIIHKLSPLGMLATCALLACAGLLALSYAPGAGMILLAATLYGVGKSFFWPTTLGVVAEQFPRGGALTLNAMGGVGMLGVGVLGAMMMGNIQDRTIDTTLAAKDIAVHAQVTVQNQSVIGSYNAVDASKLTAATPEAQALVKDVQDGSKKVALRYVAALPFIMLLCYIGLLVYFKKTRGGYRPVELVHE